MRATGNVTEVTFGSKLAEGRYLIQESLVYQNWQIMSSSSEPPIHQWYSPCPLFLTTCYNSPSLSDTSDLEPHTNQHQCVAMACLAVELVSSADCVVLVSWSGRIHTLKCTIQCPVRDTPGHQTELLACFRHLLIPICPLWSNSSISWRSVGENKHVPHNHPRGHRNPPGVQLSKPGRQWVVHHHHHAGHGVEVYYWSRRLTPLPGSVAVFRPETLRYGPVRDHHIAAAHLLCRPPGQLICECLIHFGASAHPVTRLATGEAHYRIPVSMSRTRSRLWGHTRRPQKQALQKSFRSRQPSPAWQCRGRYSGQ